MASIERRTTKSGDRFRVIWWEDGQRQQKTFFDADSAGAFKDDVETFGNHWPPGTDPRPAGPATALTFQAWAERAIAARTRASDRTRADYRRDLAAHFALLNPIPLEILRAEHVIAWMREREAACRCGRPLADHGRDGLTPPCNRPAGLSEKTRRNLHGFASSLIADALSQHPPLIAHNPFADRLTERAAIRTEDMEFLTPEEFDAVLRWVPDERNYRELLRLLFRTGLRFGEATALTVGDVNLLGQRKTLTVTKAWKRTGSSQYVIGEPKTRRSRRTLPLSPASVDMLVPLVASRPSKALLFPDTTGARCHTPRSTSAPGRPPWPAPTCATPTTPNSATDATSHRRGPSRATAPACSARCRASTTSGTRRRPCGSPRASTSPSSPSSSATRRCRSRSTATRTSARPSMRWSPAPPIGRWPRRQSELSRFRLRRMYDTRALRTTSPRLSPRSLAIFCASS
jgi:integrase